MRLQRTLSSGWEFVPERNGRATIGPEAPTTPSAGWRPIQVPGYWQAQFTDLSRSTGAGWYRTSIDVGGDWLDHDVLALVFGAVSHYCQGWLNGTYLGDHEGGHLPFTWDLPRAALNDGGNELLVRVVTPSGNRSRFPDFPFEETLHGKQSWYGPLGGIWQDVVLEARPACWVDHVDVHPDPSSGQVRVRVHLGPSGVECALRLDVVGPDGIEVAHLETSSAEGPIVIAVGAHHNLQLWSPDSPRLYSIRIAVLVDDTEIDVASKRFGFRTFTTEAGRFLLNGEPIDMRGVLDQDYTDSPGVAGSKEHVLELFAKVKAMGFNTVRCHIKIPDPMYLDAADEIGLLVWCELPTTSQLTLRARERIRRTMFAVLERDKHHPSVVVWSVANEAWGYDLVSNAEHRNWLHALFTEVRNAAPDNLFVDNSPCAPNFHIESDIEDYHFYAVIPEMRNRWDEFLDEFCAGASFTYSPHGDAIRTGAEPRVVSEFGAWGIPNLPDLEDREPWWFESGQEWADGAAYIHGARGRFSLWHLDQVFGDWEGLCLETQRRQFETMRYQIETMRSRPEIAGYVVTELSDVHWEANGLLDMFGRPRSFATQLQDLNASPTIIAPTNRAAIWSGEAVSARPTIINDGVTRHSVEIRGGITGEVESFAEPVGTIGRNEIHSLGPFEIGADCGASPEELTLACSWFEDGEQIGVASQPVLVLPHLRPLLPSTEKLVVTDAALAEHLEKLGYAVSGSSNSSSIRVLNKLNADDHEFIDAGGRCLLLATSVDALGGGFGEFPPIHLKAWNEALFGGGEWVSAFSWLRRSGQFADLPGGPLMDAAFEGLTPDVVITGIPPARFEYDVFAGVFVGWVHQIAALIARHQPGLGSLVISTLNLTGRAPDADPLASWMLHQLIAMASEQP